MEQKEEPSMEEILSSIRRILSHEEETPVRAEDDLKTAVSVPALEKGQEDVMELTSEMRVENGTLSDFEDTKEQDSIPEDMVLLSEAAVQASTDKLAHLVDSVQGKPFVQVSPQYSKSTGNLEDIVTELLRPYLKEWLDEHLPALVEKIVQKEVERLTQKVKLS